MQPVDRDYVLGSAADPNAAHRRNRTKIESAAKQALRTAGLRRITALEATSDMVTSYLITGNNDSLKLIRHLAGDGIAELLEQLRQTDSEDHP
jgi:hypothetical protein